MVRHQPWVFTMTAMRDPVPPNDETDPEWGVGSGACIYLMLKGRDGLRDAVPFTSRRAKDIARAIRLIGTAEAGTSAFQGHSGGAEELVISMTANASASLSLTGPKHTVEVEVTREQGEEIAVALDECRTNGTGRTGS